jgi:hypothetical protein
MGGEASDRDRPRGPDPLDAPRQQPDLFGDEVREWVPFSEELLNQALRRSFAPGRVAGLVALVGGPARKPIRDGRGWLARAARGRAAAPGRGRDRPPHGGPEEIEFIAEPAPR